MGFARPSGRGGSPIDALRLAQNGLLAAFLVTVMVTDWRWTRIPNYLTYPGILIGLGLSAFSGWGAVGVTGLLDHGVAVGAAFLLLIVAMIFLRGQIQNIFSNIGNNLT